MATMIPEKFVTKKALIFVLSLLLGGMILGAILHASNVVINL
ncbi:MAG: hypothetical protein WC863_02365 [Patescibacteria group bacterium]